MKKYIFLFLTLAAVAFWAFRPANNGYKVGDKATDFSLKNVDGKMVSLKNFDKAKGFIVIFTCNHCPFSVKYEDRIIDIDKKYAPMGYPVIAINPNDVEKQPEDSFDKMVERAKEKGFTFPYLYDEDQKIAQTYGASRTPHVFLLKKKGDKLTVEYIGAIDDNANDASAAKTKYLENAIADLEAGTAVKQNFTKAIGCTIKWKAS
jgi:peroxiredoxin